MNAYNQVSVYLKCQHQRASKIQQRFDFKQRSKSGASLRECTKKRSCLVTRVEISCYCHYQPTKAVDKSGDCWVKTLRANNRNAVSSMPTIGIKLGIKIIYV